MRLAAQLLGIGFLVVFTWIRPAQLSAQTLDSLCPPALCASAQESRARRLPTLGKLRQVTIIVAKLSQEDKDLGLTEEELREHLITLLESKLPELDITESSVDHVYLKVALDIEKTVWGQKSGFVGSISLAVDRATPYSAKGNSTEVWKKSFVMSGSLQEIVWNRVGSVVNRLTSLLAEDWLQANR